MDRMIRYRLEQLARRLRSQVFVGLLIVYWILLLSMFALVWKQGGAEVGVQLPKYLIFAFFALGALVLYLWSRFGYRDMKSIAECIEKRHPELDQKLLTAIEPPKPNESEFLRRKLVEETLAHAQKKDWEQIVPSGRLAALWGVQWLLLLVALSIPLMIAGKKTSNGESAGVKADKLDDWLIEPGDIQLEKGSDLLISVRFPDSFTDDLNMVATGPDGQSQVIRLQRSLKDPIASATLRRVKDSLRYRIESESKSSEMFNVEVFEHPGVVHSGALIQSPAYAKQEDKTISNTRRVSVVDGANIIWSLKLNKPVATAQWIDENGLETSLEPESDDPTAFRIASSPKGSGRYRLRLVDAQGRTEKGAEEFIVKVIPNREPELQLISASDQRVSPIQEMLVDAKVQDDFGIHRAGISVFVGDSEAQEIELKSSSNESSKKTELHHLIDLESLSAKADQLVTYHFWSEDLDRDGQPRRIDSEMFFAEVRPFEELFREGDSSATQQRQQQQEQQQQGSQGAQQAEELAELQKKIIAATWNLIRGLSNPSDDKLQAQMEKINVIRESQEQAIEQSEQLKQNLQSPESEQELFKVQTSMKDAVGELNSITADKATVGLRNALKPMRAAYEGLLRLRAREHEVTQNQQQQSSSQRSQSSSQRNRQQQIQQLQLEQDPSRYEDESQPTRQEAQAEKEMRQVMNRLDELARRQQDLNEQVREIDVALQAAKDEQEKNDLRDQLDRLREEQKELVQDADELLERMNNPDTRNALEESRRQIENAREQMQQSEQQLSNSEPSAALNSGTRAQQDVEETRQKLREESSEALERDVQRLVQQAQEVSDKQTQLRRGLQEQSGSPPGDEAGSEKSVQNNQKGKESLLRSDTELSQDVDAEKRNIDAWKDQKKDYLELLDRIKETVEQAEGSEPLLAEQLYETYREASRLPTEQRLERIPMMIERGMDQPAIEEAQEVARDLQSLKDRIEESSQSVLGSEEDSLRRAIQELETANRAINEELAQRDPGPQTRNEQSDSREGQPREGQPREGQPREGQLQQSRPDAGVQTDSAQQEPSPVGQGAGQRAGQRERAPGQRGEARSVLEQLEERMTRAGGRGGIEASAPLMGEDYAQWTDRLRDIEELVRDPDLKAEAARVREAARDFRMEYKRHSKEPQWDLVKKMISNPLQELQRKVQEELVRKTAKQNELVPLDRDPVPERFRSELDLYFERLGGEQTK